MEQRAIAAIAQASIFSEKLSTQMDLSSPRLQVYLMLLSVAHRYRNPLQPALVLRMESLSGAVDYSQTDGPLSVLLEMAFYMLSLTVAELRPTVVPQY